ncbi:uncharacterized protein LOC143546688 [Bidens hawaiensis]|uniref:uncharacterized protein LOC143546688 n=1 Tax=Bidens hawaiensis TaxID=980011 RepID=UPI00404AEBEC
MERVTSLVSLARRNVAVDSVVCLICGMEEETAEHLFNSCRFAQEIWGKVTNWCRVPDFFAFSIRDLLEAYKYALLPKDKAKVFHAICLTTLWCIWRARNEAVFEGKPVRLESVFGEIKGLSFLWVQNRAKKPSLSWNDWTRFDFGE